MHNGHPRIIIGPVAGTSVPPPSRCTQAHNTTAVVPHTSIGGSTCSDSAHAPHLCRIPYGPLPNPITVTFIHAYTRCVKVYCLCSKDKAFDKFCEFEVRVTNERELKIKALRTDGGGEYTSAKFENFLKQKGIQHEITAPYSPQQNGVAERMNRTLAESARSMIFNAGHSKADWGETVMMAAYIQNRVVTSSTGVTPYER